jgi:hypothetical protein
MATRGQAERVVGAGFFAGFFAVVFRGRGSLWAPAFSPTGFALDLARVVRAGAATASTADSAGSD